ncbi:hypothetical protein, partial [Limosilactobacillus fermentum]|uniref:hypothetical protein n=1 Tax=Limosilactobacillus fermentum TaxID=1613 RepID=UPI001CFBEC9A
KKKREMRIVISGKERKGKGTDGRRERMETTRNDRKKKITKESTVNGRRRRREKRKGTDYCGEAR